MRDSGQLTYINILLDTLQKKDRILENLREATIRQEKLLAEENLDIDAFNETISSKQIELDALNKLDEGFLDVYGKVGEALKEDPAAYADEVTRAKQLITRQMDLAVELTALEERNKTRLAFHLASGKQKVRDYKVSSRTAAAYYKNMTNKHREGDSYFMDQKK